MSARAYKGVPLSKRQKYRIYARYGFRCARCGLMERGTNWLHLDHVVPRSLGGASAQANLQPLCDRCGAWKGARTVDYRALWVPGGPVLRRVRGAFLRLQDLERGMYPSA